MKKTLLFAFLIFTSSFAFANFPLPSLNYRVSLGLAHTHGGNNPIFGVGAFVGLHRNIGIAIDGCNYWPIAKYVSKDYKVGIFNLRPHDNIFALNLKGAFTPNLSRHIKLNLQAGLSLAAIDEVDHIKPAQGFVSWNERETVSHREKGFVAVAGFDYNFNKNMGINFSYFFYSFDYGKTYGLQLQFIQGLLDKKLHSVRKKK